MSTCTPPTEYIRSPQDTALAAQWDSYWSCVNWQDWWAEPTHVMLVVLAVVVTGLVIAVIVVLGTGRGAAPPPQSHPGTRAPAPTAWDPWQGPGGRR